MNFFTSALRLRSQQQPANPAAADAEDEEDSTRKVISDLTSLIQQHDQKVKDTLRDLEKAIMERRSQQPEDGLATQFSDEELNFSLPPYLAEDQKYEPWIDSDAETVNHVEEDLVAQSRSVDHAVYGAEHDFDRDWLLKYDDMNGLKY
ncbi:hypothetical protein HDU67_008453 [Dinochytrium kinnereticum]|nr:hypothetical protein HDU67_008453 [Dinochytrium kinnereticum]